MGSVRARSRRHTAFCGWMFEAEAAPKKKTTSKVTWGDDFLDAAQHQKEKSAQQSAALEGGR